MYDCDCGISAADCHHAHLSDEYTPKVRVIVSKFAPPGRLYVVPASTVVPSDGFIEALAGCVR